MPVDFKSILENYPCIHSVEYIADKEQERNPESSKTFRLYARENGHDWKLLISITNSFPLKLPVIILENAENYPAMGHIDWYGSVCYTSRGHACGFSK